MKYAQRDGQGNLVGKFQQLQSWMQPDNEQVPDDEPLYYPGGEPDQPLDAPPE